MGAGDKVLPGNLFFLFNLSKREENSSSELSDSSSLGGAERVRLELLLKTSDASKSKVVLGQTDKGEGSAGTKGGLFS